MNGVLSVGGATAAHANIDGLASVEGPVLPRGNSVLKRLLHTQGTTTEGASCRGLVDDDSCAGRGHQRLVLFLLELSGAAPQGREERE